MLTLDVLSLENSLQTSQHILTMILLSVSLVLQESLMFNSFPTFSRFWQLPLGLTGTFLLLIENHSMFLLVFFLLIFFRLISLGFCLRWFFSLIRFCIRCLLRPFSTEECWYFSLHFSEPTDQINLTNKYHLGAY